MTKEKLEKEAEDYALTHFNDTTNNHECIDDYVKIKEAYLASAEPREKQIEIDAEQIRNLQKQKGELTDRVKELEAQIEKMKCCLNCDNWNWKHNMCEKKLKGDCFKHSKWIMRNF